jgi:hypothetical protein
MHDTPRPTTGPMPPGLVINKRARRPPRPTPGLWAQRRGDRFQPQRHGGGAVRADVADRGAQRRDRQQVLAPGCPGFGGAASLSWAGVAPHAIQKLKGLWVQDRRGAATTPSRQTTPPLPAALQTNGARAATSWLPSTASARSTFPASSPAATASPRTRWLGDWGSGLSNRGRGAAVFP